MDSNVASFNALVDKFFDFYFPLHPTAATAAGFHQFDAKLEDYTAAGNEQVTRGLKDYLTKFENVDRTNELLLGENPFPPGFVERFFTRVQAYTAGYDREVGHIPHLSTAIGGQVTWYGVPHVLKTTYGEHPVGAILFVRIRAY